MLLQTGLLPLTPRDRVGSYRGIAPFDVTVAQSAPPDCWPRLRRAVQAPSKYTNDLVEGFEAVVEALATSKSAQKFFREVILPAARDRNSRILLRATAHYARLLRESLEARY